MSHSAKDRAMAARLSKLKAAEEEGQNKADTQRIGALKKSREKQLRSDRRKDEKAENLRGGSGSAAFKRAYARIEGAWRSAMVAHYPEAGPPLAFTAKEKGLIKNTLLPAFGDDELRVIRFVRYGVEHWGEIQQDFFKKQGTLPTFGGLAVTREHVDQELRRTDALAAVEREIAQWETDNPGEFMPPPELMAKKKKFTKQDLRKK